LKYIVCCFYLFIFFHSFLLVCIQNFKNILKNESTPHKIINDAKKRCFHINARKEMIIGFWFLFVNGSFKALLSFKNNPIPSGCLIALECPLKNLKSRIFLKNEYADLLGSLKNLSNIFKKTVEHYTNRSCALRR